MRLSIVTIALRNRDGLAQTLTSTRPLLGRLGNQFEQIIVDSSPSEHGEVRSEFENNEYIRWIEFPPTGIYSALNEGIRLCRGSVVWHLHSGDVLINVENLLSALSVLEKSDRDLLVSSVELSHGKEFMFVHHHAHELKKNLLGLNSIHHQGVLMRREVFSKIGNFNVGLKISGDYEFFIRVANAGLTTLEFTAPFVRYDTVGRSFSNFSTLYSESLHLMPLLKATLIEKFISFINLHYHALRVFVLTPLFNRLGLYHILRRKFYRLKRGLS